MNTIQKIACVVLVLILAGCARGEPYRKMVRDMPDLSTSEGRIVFYRRGTILPGVVVQPSIVLDGRKVGNAKPKGFFYVDVPAGDHEISIHSEVERTLTLTVKPGETKYVREDLNVGFAIGRMVPVLVDQKMAKRELRRLRYGGALEAETSDSTPTPPAAAVDAAASDTGAMDSQSTR